MTEEVWNLLEETLVKEKPGGFVFFWGRLPEKGAQIFGGVGGTGAVASLETMLW